MSITTNNLKTSTHEVTIPFSGFYESSHSREIEYALESIYTDEDGNVDKDKVYAFSYTPEFLEAYCEAYVDYMNTEVDSNFTFSAMTSPKEYNFTTDQLFAECDDAFVVKMFSEVTVDDLECRIKQKFTSRDGFISFYSNDLEEWLEKPLLEWDHHELGTLFETWLENQHTFHEVECIDHINVHELLHEHLPEGA